MAMSMAFVPHPCASFSSNQRALKNENKIKTSHQESKLFSNGEFRDSIEFLSNKKAHQMGHIQRSTKEASTSELVALPRPASQAYLTSTPKLASREEKDRVLKSWNTLTKSKSEHSMSLFNDRYEIGMEIGRGGFGTISIVKERKNAQRLFACKTLSLNKDNTTPDNFEKILCEVRILKHLSSSPHVVDFVDFFIDDSNVHIIMELCTGGNIWDALGPLKTDPESRRIRESKVSMFIRSVVQTLVDCHKCGIVHRDIKPENFLLLHTEPDSPVKAIDFGLAISCPPGSFRKDIPQQGTPHFLPPEAILKHIGASSDLWSVGILTYFLLSEKFPFYDKEHPDQQEISGIMKSIKCGAVNTASPEISSYSYAARSFIQQLLQHNPRARPTAQELLHHPFLKEGGSASDIGTVNGGNQLRGL
mmetsp:Transcript_39161/g.54374  ORF Transcript_39161/g.54374 Transcript_39161/m.54374 type:complete len:419 (+) Transcript_39161:274-1530(+)|eukprot:CAMPEP_0196572112 /NCGR_PEP_ID=MMETSP1081-20130531/2218_1 /TAXON_ID=36882 /ORGANISM="Pyramimonas amylifera, Strain CCMP720" /LENGTH=418 /DNA_ID=CAMNT_0041889315 /DNA_START=274 /DNA_END=1530 /DNA_ORIENTATION=-